MSLRYLWIISVLFTTPILSQPAFLWTKQMGGKGNEGGISIFEDKNGNIYTAGVFNDTCDFDPGPGSFILIGNGQQDIFITKMDAAGNFLWAKQIDAYTNHSIGEGVSPLFVDEQGGVMLCGPFEDSADFDPGVAVDIHTSAGGQDAFLCKLDKSGNFVWARTWGAASDDAVTSVYSDANKNVYCTGYFAGTVDFDPGSGVSNLSSTGMYDAFISKVDSNGNFVWAKRIGGTNITWGSRITLDLYGNIYVGGGFKGTADFDPGSGAFNLSAITPPSMYSDIFICKLDPLGNFVFAKNIGGADLQYIFSLEVDKGENIFFGGLFRATTDFDPGPGTFNLIASSYEPAYIAKLNSSGNFAWAKQLDGGVGVVRDIELDSSSNIFATGDFQGTADFDPGSANYYLSAGSNGDGYICIWDSSANFRYAGSTHGAGFCYPMSIEIGTCGKIYTTGCFYQGPTDFDMGSDEFNISASGVDIFILEMVALPDSFTVNNPTEIFSSRDSICSGAPITLNIQGSPGQIASWYWFSNDSSGTFLGTGSSVTVNPANTTVYYVKAMNACNVSLCYSDTITVLAVPTASFVSSFSFDCKAITWHLKNSSTNSDSLQWFFSDGTTSSDINPSHSFEFNNPYSISLIAVNNNTCRDTFNVHNTSGSLKDYLNFSVPNIFTPNGDGINDEFKITLNETFSECFSVNIFNRWGAEVFSSAYSNFRWDGRNMVGEKISAGTYFYVIEINDVQYKGYIMLLD